MDLQTALWTLSIQLSQIKNQVDILTQQQIIEDKHVGFAEMPLALQKVALCESSGKQHYNNKIVKGLAGEVGIMQIHPVHFLRAKKMGYDLYSATGNMAYAVWLYQQEGLRPWTCATILKLTMK